MRKATTITDYHEILHKHGRKGWKRGRWIPLRAPRKMRGKLVLNANRNMAWGVLTPDTHSRMIVNYMGFIFRRKKWKKPVKDYHKAVLGNYYGIEVI